MGKDWRIQFAPKRYTIADWGKAKFAIYDRDTKKAVVTAPERRFLLGARNALNLGAVARN